DVIVAADTSTQPGPFIMPVGNAVFFRASGAGTGLELWKTDGTPAGTALVKDIFPGAGGSVPTRLTNVNGTLYFSANDQAGPARTFRSDGTPDGTVRVDSLAGSPPPGTPAA